MAKKKNQTPEEKLRALLALQVIDTKIDIINEVRGELPLEVRDLEDDIENVKARTEKIESEIHDVTIQITDKKNTIELAKGLIEKYKTQQENVRNNREYDALSKEIEFQELEIELSDKRIGEFRIKATHKEEILAESKGKLGLVEEALVAKKEELEEITAENAKEESILIEQSEKAENAVEDRLLKAYKRIRAAAVNGLAIVAVERGASGGSFIQIPPQREIDIAARKKIIIDEHSGRILVDPALAEEVETKITKKLARLFKAAAKSEKVEEEE